VQHARAADQRQPVGWLVVFAEVEGFRWVVQHSRMAFSEGMARRARRIQPSDRLVLYLAHGAFHNPTRDRSQLGGLTTVTTPLERLAQVLRIAEREFAWGCDLKLDVVLREREGIPIQSLVPRLSFLQGRQQWGVSFRPGLIQLPDADLELMTTAIRNAAKAQE
jgi:hypothetical protein